MRSDVSADLIQAFLDDAWNNAAQQANSLREQLSNEQSSALAMVKKGSLGTVAKNSSSQGYRGYGPGSLTHTQIVEIWQRLIRYYDELEAKITCLFSEQDAAIPDGFDFDQPIYDLITKLLDISNNAAVLPDLTKLRTPATLSPVNPTSW